MAPKKIPLKGGAGKGRGGGRATGKGRVEKMAEADSDEDEGIDLETGSRSQDIGDDTLTNTSKDTAVKLNAVMKWQNRVFVPRGIYISDEEIWEPGFFHFKFFEADGELKADEEQCREWVMQKIDLQEDEDTVFLRGGDKFNQGLAAQYTEMVSRRLCEEEFATLAKEKLFRRPPFLPVEGSGRAWKPERVIQLSTKVGSNRWVPPPLLNGEDLDGCKDFNLRPDCAYWLSVQAFSKSHRGLVERATYTPSDTHRIITPYLTIEFKKTDKTVEQATNQAIAASALALFNRFQLKENYLNIRKRAWNKNHFDQIRHYAITFTGPTAIIWLIKLKEPSDTDFSKVSWNGCEAVKIWKSVCSDSGDVDDLVDYINAIHRWGIGHGENCRRDVKGILMLMAGVRARVSELFDPNELEQDDEN